MILYKLLLKNLELYIIYILYYLDFLRINSTFKII